MNTDNMRPHRGRPFRALPDNVLSLAQSAYRTGGSVTVQLPADTTPEEIDQLRLDLRSAARRLHPRGYPIITGLCDPAGPPIMVDRRRDKDRWQDIRALVISIRAPRVGSVTT